MFDRTRRSQNPEVLHFVSDIDERFGGPSQVVPLLAASLEKDGISSIISYIETLEKSQNEIVDRFGLRTHGFSLSFSRKLYLSRGLGANLARNFTNPFPDIIHIHSIWRFPTLSFVRFAKRHGIPIVVSLHSSLYSESLAKSAFIKRLARLGYVDSLLSYASFIHTTEPRESEAAIEFGISPNKIISIPNGLEPVRMERVFGDDRSNIARRIPVDVSRSDRVALFLARVHPRKNVLELITAARDVLANNSDWKLVIAGPCEDDAYLRRCKAAAGPFLDAGRIVFVGMLRGEAKAEMLAVADLFILPTKFENFGISIGEALAVGLPVITTTTTPWQQIADTEAGWIIPPNDIQALTGAWSTAAQCSDATLRQMGARGRPLVKPFTWDVLAKDFSQHYAKLIGQ